MRATIQQFSMRKMKQLSSQMDSSHSSSEVVLVRPEPPPSLLSLSTRPTTCLSILRVSKPEKCLLIPPSMPQPMHVPLLVSSHSLHHPSQQQPSVKYISTPPTTPSTSETIRTLPGFLSQQVLLLVPSMPAPELFSPPPETTLLPRSPTPPMVTSPAPISKLP